MTCKYLNIATVASINNPLKLTLGGNLNEIMVTYETYGKLTSSKDNVILVTHALTGDSHPAAHDKDDNPGWWEELIGPGRTLDTNRFYIICSNVLGGCYGTTGPSSINSQTGKQYGINFPTITIKDMVNVQKRLLEYLGITHLVMVVGGSMGGMQALEWGVTYPDFMDSIIAIAAPGHTSAQSIAYNCVGRKAIMLDPSWNNGDYYDKDEIKIGLALARELGMITYQSEQSMMNKFGRKIRNGNFEVENYLEYQGGKLAQRFDANSYLYLLKAIDLYNLGEGYSSYQTALSRIKAKVLVIGVSSDILYPSYQQYELFQEMRQAKVEANYIEIDSKHGHDGFLIDFHLLKPVLVDFINSLIPDPFIKGQMLFRASSFSYLGA